MYNVVCIVCRGAPWTWHALYICIHALQTARGLAGALTALVFMIVLLTTKVCAEQLPELELMAYTIM